MHCWTTHASQNTLRKWVALLSVPQLLYFSTDLFHILCLCRLYHGLLRIVKKTVLLWKHLAVIFERGTFDYFNLTVKFRYWSCSDVQHNWENLVAVLKELTPPPPFRPLSCPHLCHLFLSCVNAQEKKCTRVLLML